MFSGDRLKGGVRKRDVKRDVVSMLTFFGFGGPGVHWFRCVDYADSLTMEQRPPLLIVKERAFPVTSSLSERAIESP